MAFIIIALIIVLIIIIVLVIKYKLFTKFLLDNFKRCNVLVSGKKGSGKDLVFEYVIQHRKDDHYANIPYEDNTEVVEIKDVSCYPNDYEHIVNGQIKQTGIDGNLTYNFESI